jgi:hypothetical protein
MPAKGQRGRRALPAGEAKSRMLSCRVRPEEERAIRAAARAAGKPLALWIRERLLEAARVKTRAAARTRAAQSGGAGSGESSGADPKHGS